MKTVVWGRKEIDLTLEEEFPENPTRVVRFKIVGSNGLQTKSMEEMLRLLEGASEKPAVGVEHSAFSQRDNRKTRGAELDCETTLLIGVQKRQPRCEEQP